MDPFSFMGSMARKILIIIGVISLFICGLIIAATVGLGMTLPSIKGEDTGPMFAIVPLLFILVFSFALYKLVEYLKYREIEGSQPKSSVKNVSDILKLIELRPGITQAEITKTYDISEDKTNEYIRILINQNMVRQTIDSGTARYFLRSR